MRPGAQKATKKKGTIKEMNNATWHLEPKKQRKRKENIKEIKDATWDLDPQKKGKTKGK